MNLRGAGSGFGLARSFYHGGKTDDLRAVADWLAAPGPGLADRAGRASRSARTSSSSSPPRRPTSRSRGSTAWSPPTRRSTSTPAAGGSSEPRNRIYDRNFLRNLRAEVARLHAAFPDLGPVDLSSARSLLDFDELYTAPRNGFRDADRLLRPIAAPGR